MNIEAIYKKYRDKLLRFTLNYTKNREEREDLLQDIFYNILLSLPQFKNRSSLNTYIYAIARNVCVGFIKNNIKERNKKKELHTFAIENSQKSAEEEFSISKETDFFMEVINKLEEDHREIYFLAEVEGLKYKEIAEILSIPIGTVKSRLNRSKEQIMNLLKTKEDSK